METNPYFDTALQYVNFTSRNVYLTGKAGTGKTTFLKYLKDNSFKKLSIVAPTGIAAINAGGVTIHSFFQLPLGPFVPTRQNTRQYSLQGINNQQSIFHQMRLSNEKRRLIQELELLIIDEVSMVRADLLDAVDIVLRVIRRQPGLPFGGVQMLFIGDLYQLPPVIKDEEWKALHSFYESPFFFHSQVLKNNPPLYIELKKIYRQSDAEFIKVLNNIRNNQATKEDFDLLHKYHKPGFQPKEDEGYITLTTHNVKADTINIRQLKKLPGKLNTFKAIIEGNFDEKNFPADLTLNLKEGAQVMFIKNDKGEPRRYYNGKIARISKIREGEIYVRIPESGMEIKLEREVWKKVKYKFNNESDRIEEEPVGTFSQYPVRLAWAITIHKSQGLTFDKAIIDAIDSFTPGQVYVALSRLTSLEGLVLSSRIDSDCISSDKQIQSFSRSEANIDHLQEKLQNEKREFLFNTLLEVFNWKKLVTLTEEFINDFEGRKIPMQEEAKKLAEDLLEKIKKQQETADKFCVQLKQLIQLNSEDKYQKIAERTEAGVNYFIENMKNNLFNQLQAHYDEMKIRPKTKKYIKEVQDLVLVIKRKKQQLEQAVNFSKGLAGGMEAGGLIEQMKKKDEGQPEKNTGISSSKIKKEKNVRGESHRISLQMFNEGMSISEIAGKRCLATGTIEGHLISFVSKGELDLHKLVNKEKSEKILNLAEESGDASMTALKEKLGENFSFGEIRAVLSYMKRAKEIEI
jgi:hypothetical protein